MADILPTQSRRGASLYFRVQWRAQDGSLATRFFKSRNKAEQFALKTEVKLLNDAVSDLIKAIGSKQANPGM